MTALGHLDLERTPVTDVTLLAGLTVLRVLDLTGITPAGVDQLRRPGLEIRGVPPPKRAGRKQAARSRKRR